MGRAGAALTIVDAPRWFDNLIEAHRIVMGFELSRALAHVLRLFTGRPKALTLDWIAALSAGVAAASYDKQRAFVAAGRAGELGSPRQGLPSVTPVQSAWDAMIPALMADQVDRQQYYGNSLQSGTIFVTRVHPAQRAVCSAWKSKASDECHTGSAEPGQQARGD